MQQKLIAKTSKGINLDGFGRGLRRTRIYPSRRTGSLTNKGDNLSSERLDSPAVDAMDDKQDVKLLFIGT